MTFVYKTNYAHYIKNGEEVFVEKKDALYGMLNDTLLKPSQTMTLTSDYDYDSVQFEFRAVYGGTSNYIFCDCTISALSTEKLHDASIVNGTITGERGTKSSTYPNWAKDGATEASCSIVFSQGENNGIKNVNVKDSVGFNMSSGDGNLINAQYVSYKGLELGAFDSQGNKTDCSTMIRNADYYDVTKWTTNKYILGYHFGYQDIEQWSHSRIYDVFYYDKDKNLISYEKGLMRFRQYEMPEGTCYMNIALYDSEVPKSGNTDFNGAISLIEERDLPIRNFIEDCVIENNYSTGFAACGGQRWSIKGNTWKSNGGRMPGCDIDWEDGWNYMQCDMISENQFMSYNNVITCAGMYSSVFNNNKFYGVSTIYAKSNFYSFVNNQFIKDTDVVANSAGKVSFGARSDVWLYNNTFAGGVVSTQVNHSEADYCINMIGNHFTSGLSDGKTVAGSLVTGARTYVTDCDFTGKMAVTSDEVSNCTFKDCENLTVKGTVKDSKMENVVLFPGNGDYMNIISSDLYDVTVPETANKVNSVLFDKCNIIFEKKTSFLPTSTGIKTFTISNSNIEFKNGQDTFMLFSGWNLTGSTTEAVFKNNKVTKAEGFHGVLINAAWMGDSTSESKFVLKLINTNFDELTDSNKTTGNFQIIRDAQE